MDLTWELALYFLAFALLLIAGIGIGPVNRRTAWAARLNLPCLAGAALVLAFFVLPLV